MCYTKPMFGYELKEQILRKQNIIDIGKWAFSTYWKHCDNIEDELREIMLDLNTMEMGPEFAISYEMLHKIANDLIAEKDIDLSAPEYKEDVSEFAKTIKIRPLSITRNATGLLEVSFCTLPGFNNFKKLIQYMQKNFKATVGDIVDSNVGEKTCTLRINDQQCTLIYDDGFGNYLCAPTKVSETIIYDIGKDIERKLTDPSLLPDKWSM